MMAFRDPEEIAERLNKYADAITAFVVLESIAFIVGLANKDFCQAVINAGRIEISALFSLGYLFAACLVWLCHKGEDELLGQLNREENTVSRSISFIRTARLIIMTLANLVEFIAYLSVFHR